MAFRDTGVASKNQRRSGWEDADFPIVCETCLGDNPYLRMIKASFDKECKVCTRPFTVFRWKPGSKARYKKTEICQICAKLKNVCQTCLLDLEFGLPVQVRDSQLAGSEELPVSDVNREYYQDQVERQIEQGKLTWEDKNRAVSEALQKLVRSEPYYTRNRAHICSFFLKGTCTRGNQCPYRHELPDDNPELAQQNIKDRYYGVNDPVARKMLTKLDSAPKLTPPPNVEITTLYVGGVLPHITEEDLRDQFYAYGEITSLVVVPAKQCAFVTYSTREGAERAATALYNKVTVKGVPLRIAWGKSGPGEAHAHPPGPPAYPPGAVAPAMTPYMARLPPPPGIPPPPPGLPPPLPGVQPLAAPPRGLPPGISVAPPVSLDTAPPPIYYPSMDPAQFGSRPAEGPPPGHQPAKKKIKTGLASEAPAPGPALPPATGKV